MGWEKVQYAQVRDISKRVKLPIGSSSDKMDTGGDLLLPGRCVVARACTSWRLCGRDGPLACERSETANATYMGPSYSSCSSLILAPDSRWGDNEDVAEVEKIMGRREINRQTVQ